MTTKEVAAKIGCDESKISKHKGVFRYHVSYYWGFTNGPEKLIKKVSEVFSNAEIVDSGNHYHDFVGGAKSGSAKDSFLWVKFKLN